MSQHPAPDGAPSWSTPPVTISMQRYDPPLADRLDTAGYWRVEPAFPFPGATEQVLHLHPSGRCSVRSTETAFHVTVEIDVATAGLPHHQQRWSRTYPRHLL
jgi:hypothetical protein